MATKTFAISLSNSTIGWANEHLDLSYSDISRFLGVDRRTVFRWRHGEHAPARGQRQRIEKLRELRYLLERIFPDDDEALEWLHSSVPMLRGRSPYAEIQQGNLDGVVAVLAALESGAFV